MDLGKVAFQDNYRATLDGEEYTFYAVTDRQAWYLAYQWADGELVDSLCEIDAQGNAIRELLEEE